MSGTPYSQNVPELKDTYAESGANPDQQQGRRTTNFGGVEFS